MSRCFYCLYIPPLEIMIPSSLGMPLSRILVIVEGLSPLVEVGSFC